MPGCQKKALVLVLTLLVASCSSTPSFERVDFEHWVAENASKRFRFSVPLGGGTPGSEPGQRISAEDAEDLLDDYMDHVGYCSQGYFVYARNFSGPRYHLEGECQEPSG